MESKKKNKSKRQLKTSNKPPVIFPTIEEGDLAWVLLQYKREQRKNPEQNFIDFLMNYGPLGLPLRVWFSVDSLFSSPEYYVCVWHGTSLSRAVQILSKGFICPAYTSFEPHVCLSYAERRARVEDDFPALIACVLDLPHAQKHLAAQPQSGMYLVFNVPPDIFTQFIFIPSEAEISAKNPAFETWRIYAHIPDIVPPSQDKINALLDEWDFAREKL